MNDICGYCLDKEATMKRFFDICNFYEEYEPDNKEAEKYNEMYLAIPVEVELEKISGSPKDPAGYNSEKLAV